MNPVVEPEGPARFRLRGIPFLWGECLAFRAGVTAGDEADRERVEAISRSVTWHGAIPNDPRDPLVAVAMLPRPDAPPAQVPFRAPGGSVPG